MRNAELTVSDAVDRQQAPIIAQQLGRHEGLSNTGEGRVVYHPDGADPESNAWIDAPRSAEVDLGETR
jgi:hypothetical protein